MRRSSAFWPGTYCTGFLDPPPSGRAFPRPIDGREAVINLFSGAPEALRYRSLLTVADEHGAAVFAHMTSTLTEGQDVENNYAWCFRIRDGRIAGIFEQPDTAHAFDFFGI
jgi:ketosteroid isomerase-like protein